MKATDVCAGGGTCVSRHNGVFYLVWRVRVDVNDLKSISERWGGDRHGSVTYCVHIRQ